MKVRSALILSLLLFMQMPLSTYQAAALQNNNKYDLIITGGRIVDGTGNPWFTGDVAIKDGKIVDIGQLDSNKANRLINANGKIVAPGFIDVHAHIEGDPTEAENYLQMGVTSVVTGNCGGSELNIDKYFSSLEKTGTGVNVASLIGHNTVRRAGMNGDFNRVPTTEELQKMRDFVDKAMQDGAVGISTGLIYIPGTFAKTDEVVELAKASAARGGIYASHIRSEGEHVIDAVNEAINIGVLASCPVEISHFKVSNKNLWGLSSKTIKLVEEARLQGRQVTVDQYLYPASSTTIRTLLPSSALEGGSEKIKSRFQNVEYRSRIAQEIIDGVKKRGFNDLSFAYVADYQADKSFNGKNLVEITTLVKKKSDLLSQAEQTIDIVLGGGAQMVYHTMSEIDIENIIRQPFTMVAADAGVIPVDDPSNPHPRAFGNNPRVLARYVRDKKIIGLEDAVRKMTSLPAQTFKLWDRGLLRPGMAADIVIFDENVIQDKATFEQPKQYPVGFSQIIVNGKVAIENGKYIGVKAGTILRKR